MKKFIALLTALILLLSVFAPAVFAEDAEVPAADTVKEIRILGGDSRLSTRYKYHIRIEADAYGVDDNNYITIELIDSDGKGAGSTETRNYYCASFESDRLTDDSYTVYARLHDADGSVIAEDSQAVTVKINFFEKIIAFFRGLFKIDAYKDNDFSDEDYAFQVKCLAYSNNSYPVSTEEFFTKLASIDKYTVKAVNRTESADGTVTTTPITIMKSGSKIYFEAAAPVDDAGNTMTMFIIVDSSAKTCRAYIPSARIMTDIPYSSVEELMDEYGDVSQDDTGDVYLGSTTEIIDGKTYNVSTYKNNTDDSVKKYYFDGNVPVKVIVESADGTVSVTDYTILLTVDESKLEEPIGYIKADISGMTD